jgi:hypothetical protein
LQVLLEWLLFLLGKSVLEASEFGKGWNNEWESKRT